MAQHSSFVILLFSFMSPGMFVLLSVLSYVVLVVLGDTRSYFLSWLIHVASRLFRFRTPRYISLSTSLCVPSSFQDTMSVEYWVVSLCERKSGVVTSLFGALLWRAMARRRLLSRANR